MDIKSKFKSIKFNKKIVIISLIAVVIVGTAVTSYTKAQKSKVKQVSISKVSKKKLTQTATSTGNIEANYRNDIVLNPNQKVVKVLVTEGQQVKKGDILAQLDISDYKSQLEKQKLNLASAQTTLNQLSSTGIENEKNTASNAVSQAEVTLENSQRNYEDVKKKLAQNEQLFKSGYISQNDYDASKKAVEDASSAIRAAENSLSSAQSSLSNVNTTGSDKITNQRNQIALIQADIDNLNKKIEDSNLRANTDGIVVRVDAKEDQLPKAGDMIIVDDVSSYKVVVDMNQYDAVKVAKGQKVNIKVKGSTKKYTGTVTEVGQTAQAKINAASGSADQEFKVKVKVTMDNPDENIKAGYEADVEVVLNEKPSAAAVTFDGLKEEKSTGKKYVYLVNDKNIVSKKYIKTGLETDYDVEVIDGLKAGDKYILNPADTLHEGDKVAEAANKNGGSKK